jgi:PAS domain S-box-containing protein
VPNGRAKITEEKNAEESSLVKEDSYRSIFNIVPLAFVVWDKDHCILDWNRHAEQIFGWTHEEVIGRNFFDLIIPKDKDTHERVVSITNDLMENIVEPHIINENITKDGKIITCEWNNAVLHDRDGRPNAVISTALDITERRKAEELLKNSEGQMKAILLHAPIGIATSDSNMVFQSANEAFCRILGFSEEELKRLTFREITHPEDLNVSNANMEELAAGRIPFFSQEKHYIRKDGTIIDGKVTIGAVLDKEGKPALFVAELEDITDLKKGHEALEKSAANSKNIINGMTETAWIIDFDGNFIDVNDAAVKVFGYSREELLSLGVKGIDKHLSQEQLRKLSARWQTVRTQVFETLHTTKDGTQIPVEISSSIITYNNKNVILSIARNITERKEMDEKLKMQTRTLEGINTILLETLKTENEEELCAKCLDILCDLTGSQLAFMDELDKNLSVKNLAINAAGWDACEIPRKRVQDLLHDSLAKIGKELAISKESLIVNDFPNSPYRRYAPEGHPTIEGFLGVPFGLGQNITGLIGLANKKKWGIH